jgi:hypothetical protein
MQLPARRSRRGGFTRGLTLASTVALLSGLLSVPVLAALTAEPAAAAANAVVPGSAIAGFTPVPFAGNDDGTYPCGGSGNAPPPCTGSQTGPATVPLGFNVNFFGTEYSGVYINNNGNITFDNPLPTYTPFGLANTRSVIIAPFFADVDTRLGNIVNFGTGTLNGHTVFVVNWPGVGCFQENDTVTNNFQLILIDRPDRATGALGDDFDIEFNYDSVQWDAGQASGGDDNCTNAASSNSAVAGFSNGTPTPGDSFQLAGSQTTGAFLDSNTSTGLIYNDLNSNVQGRYIFTVTGGTPGTAASTSLAVKAAAGDFGDATAVSAVLTNSNTSAPVAGKSITFTLHGTETCTATTDATGMASCEVTPKEAAGMYTLAASFAGDSGFLASSGSADFTVNAEETALSYTGDTSAVNGQSVTLSGVLSTDDPALGTALPGKAVTFTLGSGAAVQSCQGTTDASGAASCVVEAVNQTPGGVPVAASFAGDGFYQAANASSTVTVSGQAPTSPMKDALVSKFNRNGKVKVRITTRAPSDLLVAFVGAGGPWCYAPHTARSSTGQAAQVTGGGLTWTLVARTNTEQGTSEIWTARASGVVSKLQVRATLADPHFPIYLTVVAFSHATGVGTSSSASGRTGAPTGTLTTTSSPSWVWAVGEDPLAAIGREVPPDQTLQAQQLAKTDDTYWVQSLNDETAPSGTLATIRDEAPETNPWNLTLVEIL